MLNKCVVVFSILEQQQTIIMNLCSSLHLFTFNPPPLFSSYIFPLVFFAFRFSTSSSQWIKQQQKHEEALVASMESSFLSLSLSLSLLPCNLCREAE